MVTATWILLYPQQFPQSVGVISVEVIKILDIFAKLHYLNNMQSLTHQVMQLSCDLTYSKSI